MLKALENAEARFEAEVVIQKDLQDLQRSVREKAALTKSVRVGTLAADVVRKLRQVEKAMASK